MQEPSIFTKIVNGEIPSHKIYEDDTTLAFLDIFSPVPGHVLVIPKKQVDALWDLDDSDYAAVMETARKVARKQREVLGVSRVGVKVVGVDVPHAHVHLIPFNDVKIYHEAGLKNIEPDQETLTNMEKTLKLTS